MVDNQLLKNNIINGIARLVMYQKRMKTADSGIKLLFDHSIWDSMFGELYNGYVHAVWTLIVQFNPKVDFLEMVDDFYDDLYMLTIDESRDVFITKDGCTSVVTLNSVISVAEYYMYWQEVD